MMRVAVTVVLLTAVLASGGLPSSGFTGEPSDPALKKDMRERAEELWRAVKQGYFVKCGRCRGLGKISVYEMVEKPYGRRGQTRRVRTKVGEETCPTCKGLPYGVNQDVVRVLFFKMKSPAFQKQHPWKPDRKRFDYPEKTIRRPVILDAYELMYNIRKTELVDKTHGITWVKPRIGKRIGVRWIRIEDKTKRGTWYVWDRRADGAWPGEEEQDPSESPQDESAPAGEPRPLDRAVQKAVKSKLASLKLAYQLIDVGTIGKQLVLVFQTKTSAPYDEQDAEDFVGRDAAIVTRTMLAGKHPWIGLKCIWRRQFRDKFGQVEWKPGMTSVMDQETFAKIVWKNLTTEEAGALLTWQKHVYEGWVAWR